MDELFIQIIDEIISKWMNPPMHGPPFSIIGDKKEVGSLELPTLLLVAVAPHCCCWFLWLPKKERGRMKERGKKMYIKKRNKTMMALWIKTRPFFKVVFLFCFVFFFPTLCLCS